jgi:hypothetical protein
MITNDYKEFTGDKYIYYAMAYKLAKENGGRIAIGADNGHTGEQKFIRWFSIHKYKGDIILTETKNTPSFTLFSRYFKVIEGKNRTRIYEYINEDGENCSKRWDH